MVDEFDDPAASTGCERFLKGMREISPANLLIKIESFSLLSKYGITKHESRLFEAGGYKWKVIICVDVYDGEHYISAYLSIAETESLPRRWEVNAKFTFFIYNHIWDNYVSFQGKMRRFNAVIPKYGFSKLISKKSLIDPSEGYLKEDSCVFGAEVFVFTQPISECLSLTKDGLFPFKRKWKISEFSKCENIWYSEEFEVGDCKWEVLLYPKGNGTLSAKDHVSIFLQCVDSEDFGPHDKVKVQAALRIKSNLINTHHAMLLNAWYTSSSSNWGFPDFIALADMRSRGLLVDDCCILDVEISVQALIRDAPKI